MTSGSPAPYLKKNIGLAFVPVNLQILGKKLKLMSEEKCSRPKSYRRLFISGKTRFSEFERI